MNKPVIFYSGNTVVRPGNIVTIRGEYLDSVKRIAVSDGKNITFTWEKGSGQPVTPPSQSATPGDTTAPAAGYIGNKNSKKLHLPTCSSLPSESNRVHFDDYDAAIAAGYEPCSKCLP